jgi:hypothetical protein
MVTAPSAPLRLFASFQTVRPARDELLDFYRQNFSARGIPKSQPVRELIVDVMLSPARMPEGGRLPFEVPIARTCELCGGSGRTGYFHCDGCDGGGLVWETAHLDVLLPAVVRDGTDIPVSLSHLGVHNLYLRLRIRLAND